jgi:hypothetical protein
MRFKILLRCGIALAAFHTGSAWAAEVETSEDQDQDQDQIVVTGETSSARFATISESNPGRHSLQCRP